MTLAKLMLGDDGSAVTLVAWANPDLHKAGDVDGAWSYVDVDMTDEEIDATKVPAAAGAVTLTDGKLVVAADYVPEPEPTPVDPGPSVQDQMLAALGLQVAANTAAIAAKEATTNA